MPGIDRRGGTGGGGGGGAPSGPAGGNLAGTYPNPTIPGYTRVYSYNFAYNTPNLATGVTVWTPAVGDVLLDAWFFITTAFDGTTPTADVGTFVGSARGLFYYFYGAPDISAVDNDGGGGIGTGTLASNANGRGLATLRTPPGGSTFFDTQVEFTATNPLKLVVSQDGTAGGTPIGGAAGAGTLYLMVATPTAL